MTAQPTINGIPQMGFGTWERRGQACVDTVLWAFEAGYRHIDTAFAYENEREVGQALRASGLARGDYFLTTKVPPERLAPGKVDETFSQSLDMLGLDYVDMLLCHWPSIGDEYDIAEYLGQFAAIQASGRAKRIGVSNFTRRHVDQAVEVLGAEAITTNQCEIHVLMQNTVIAAHCRALGIPMTAYCPMGRGAFLDHPELAAIAVSHGATIGQIGLAFLLAEGHFVIPSSSSRERIAENFGALEVRLSDADMAAIRAMDEGRRLVDGAWAPEWDPAR